ncbi:BTAD domain-containing putative transcriptional regulator [Microbispora sp. NPDC049125]|uniref:BTAD domain-containing putative transcriptional regulator n=1 Tax=Microbispora sp. NPDC049125 TaxID=3154929 RepID=UPI003466D1A4
MPPRRTAGDVLAGIAALLALIGLVGGVPYALIRLAGPPISSPLLDPDLFTSRVGPETIIAILVLLVWLAWLQLFLCVVVEVYAGLRHVGMPARVPLSGGTQALANRLVSAVLLLFTATAVAVPIARAGLPAPIRPQVAALSAPVETEAERPALHAREVKKVYVVQPPHGRHHESLWEIADKCLGDGRRYHEIYRLNQHKEQPDGSRLHMADLIRPGWVLDMPDDARNVHVVPVEEDRPAVSQEHRGKPAELDGGTHYGSGAEAPGAAESRTGSSSGAGSGTGSGSSAGGRGDATPDAHEGDLTRPDHARPTPGTATPGNPKPDEGGAALPHASGTRHPGTPATPGIVLPPPAMPEHTGTARPAPPATGRPGAHPSAPPTTRPAHPATAHPATAHPATAHPGTAHSGTANPATRTPATTTPAEPPAAGRPGSGPGLGPEAGTDRAPGMDMVDYLAATTLASAGLLAVLGRRRREQLWRRAFGRRVVRPRGDAADAEVAIRLGADAPGSRMLDIGLRLLGRLLADRGRRLPTVFAVHLSSRGLDLWVHPSDEDVPEPWEACDGGQVWRLPAHEGRRIDEHVLAGTPAPYPGLVSLGTGEGGRVLVDLEAAHGVIAMTGAHTVAALSALAVELATNRWSDHMRITLVGFGEELALIAPERITTAGSMAEVLPEFEERARHTGDVLTGRIHGRVADPAWTPHYLLSALRPDEDEARRLALLGKGRRTASGFVVAGDVPHATWTWEITEDGRARIDALGFDVRAHLLPRRHYDAVVTLFRTAQRTEGEPLAGSGGPLRAGPGTAPAERLPDEPPSIEVRILGPIEISPVNPLEEGRAAIAHELVVYLATHPAGVHPVVLGGVLWPRGVQPAVRDATIARVAEWLGTDSEGRPHISPDGSGRLRLGPEVRTDWRLFQDLVRRAGECADAARPGEVEAGLLEQALGLVRGPLLNGRPGNRYAWLAADSLEYDVTAWVADAAHALCEIRLAQDDPHAAVAAARAGLLLAADDEGLWRDLLRAAHATGDPARLRAVVDGLHRRAASHPYGGGMAPETEALIDELLPDWRGGAAHDLRTPRLA